MSPVERSAFPERRVWVAVTLVCITVASVLAVATGSVRAGAVAAIVMCSLAVGWSDVCWRRIPNVVVAGMVAFAVVCAFVVEEISMLSIAAGGVASASAMFVLHLINPRWVGFGDVKLLFALGALFGLLWWPLGMAVLWLGSLAAVLSRPFVAVTWRQSVPFGFWLAAAAIPVAMFSPGSVVS